MRQWRELRALDNDLIRYPYIHSHYSSFFSIMKYEKIWDSFKNEVNRFLLSSENINTESSELNRFYNELIIHEEKILNAFYKNDKEMNKKNFEYKKRQFLKGINEAKADVDFKNKTTLYEYFIEMKENMMFQKGSSKSTKNYFNQLQKIFNNLEYMLSEDVSEYFSSLGGEYKSDFTELTDINEEARKELKKYDRAIKRMDENTKDEKIQKKFNEIFDDFVLALHRPSGRLYEYVEKIFFETYFGKNVDIVGGINPDETVADLSILFGLDNEEELKMDINVKSGLNKYTIERINDLNFPNSPLDSKEFQYIRSNLAALDLYSVKMKNDPETNRDYGAEIESKMLEIEKKLVFFGKIRSILDSFTLKHNSMNLLLSYPNGTYWTSDIVKELSESVDKAYTKSGKNIITSYNFLDFNGTFLRKTPKSKITKQSLGKLWEAKRKIKHSKKAKGYSAFFDDIKDQIPDTGKRLNSIIQKVKYTVQLKNIVADIKNNRR